MHILSVLCIGWVLGMQVICIEFISLYVQVFISSVNEHCDHYLIVIACLIKPWFVSLLYLYLIISCLLYMHFMFFCIQWSWCIVVFQQIRVSANSCSYDSRASQFLELGVSELCSTIPNSHVKSRVCFRVLSWNSQRGRL